MKTMGITRRCTAGAITAAWAVVAVATTVASPAGAETPDEKFISDIKKSNSVATDIPGTPERWLAAGYASCDRITRTTAQGLNIRAAINNEVIAATTFNVIPRQDAVALVTYAVLDLCPQLIPPRAGAPDQPAPQGDPAMPPPG